MESLFREQLDGGRYLHIGLVGHGGTGKSTMIRHAMGDLRNIGILPIYINARESFDQVDMAFADVILVLAEAVVRTLVDQANTLTMDPRHLELVREWFAEVVVSREHRGLLFGELETEASASLAVPAIAKLAALVKGILRSSNEYREEIRLRAARDPDELIRGVNELLDAAHQGLAARKQRLCVVFDNLEKIQDRHQVDVAVLRRADDLRRLRCHVVYFLSPADQHTPTTSQIDQIFQLVEVPVIPIRTDRDAPVDFVDRSALEAISSLLGKRMVLDELFADPNACVQAIARWSGGRLRDIIDLARQACEFAHFDPHADSVQPVHVDRAARKLAARRLTVMTPSCWPRAAEVHASKQVDNRPEDALMLRHSLVLAYDGAPWWDVHPFVVQDARFARAATVESSDE
ncbi:MAG TPA: AAA family ATPase [Enhygromyxa sp.]|nr:AAA family ATPase [Enhygromyxa sp.]